jgi:transaldolase
MKFFLDSGNLNEIYKVMSFLNIDGITTNPKLSTIQNAIQIALDLKIPTSIQIEPNDLENCLKIKHLEMN